MLNDKYYQTIDQYKNSKGIDCVVALLETFMDFCSDNYLYSEALLDYFAMVRFEQYVVARSARVIRWLYRLVTVYSTYISSHLYFY